MTDRFDWASLPEEELARISALPAEALVKEILGRDPHTSGGELRDWLASAGHDVTKAQAQRWRAEFKAGTAPRAPVFGGQPTPWTEPPAGDQSLAEARRRLEEATRLGDQRAASAWSGVVARLAAIEPEEGPGMTGGDWSRLTEAETEVLYYLTAKAYGVAPADERVADEWRYWAERIARERRDADLD